MNSSGVRNAVYQPSGETLSGCSPWSPCTAEPSITLVDGLLEGDHCVSDCLAKGNFGLGTLDYLDGEVMVYDGVAYHQGLQGVRVLKGDERTPFMTVTLFDKQRCKQTSRGHVLQMEVTAGATAYLQVRIKRAQVELPYSEAWMDHDLMLKPASAELAAAEK